MSNIQAPKTACVFRDVSVELAGTGEERRKFRMVANSGGVISGHPFWGNLAIDLEGLEIGRQTKPALRDHDSEQIVGYTDAIEVTAEGLIASGYFTDKTVAGREVLALADDGFPWQASVYVPPGEVEKVPAGTTKMVNGHELHGPGTIFRSATLREVTFTALGADENTTAAAFATGDTIDVSVRKGDPMGDEKDLQPDASEAKTTPVPEVDVEQLRREAVEAERLRAREIRDAALPGQDELAAQLIADGVDLPAAAFALLADAKTRPAPAPAATAKTVDELRAASSPQVGVEEIVDKPAQLTADDEWSKDTDGVQSQFRSKGAFLAFRKAAERGLVTINGRKAVK